MTEIVYCDQCELRISRADTADGRFTREGKLIVCADCRPIAADAPPAKPQDQTQTVIVGDDETLDGSAGPGGPAKVRRRRTSTRTLLAKTQKLPAPEFIDGELAAGGVVIEPDDLRPSRTKPLIAAGIAVAILGAVLTVLLTSEPPPEAATASAEETGRQSSGTEARPAGPEAPARSANDSTTPSDEDPLPANSPENAESAAPAVVALKWIDPAPGTAFDPRQDVNLRVEVAQGDGDVDRVVYAANGERIGEARAPFFLCRWTAMDGDGPVTLQARGLDASGTLVGEGDLEIYIGTPPPEPPPAESSPEEPAPQVAQASESQETTDQDSPDDAVTDVTPPNTATAPEDASGTTTLPEDETADSTTDEVPEVQTTVEEPVDPPPPPEPVLLANPLHLKANFGSCRDDGWQSAENWANPRRVAIRQNKEAQPANDPAPARVYRHAHEGDVTLDFPVEDGRYLLRLHFPIESDWQQRGFGLVVDGVEYFSRMQPQRLGATEGPFIIEVLAFARGQDGLQVEVKQQGNRPVWLAAVEVRTADPVLDLGYEADGPEEWKTLAERLREMSRRDGILVWPETLTARRREFWKQHADGPGSRQLQQLLKGIHKNRKRLPLGFMGGVEAMNVVAALSKSRNSRVAPKQVFTVRPNVAWPAATVNRAAQGRNLPPVVLVMPNNSMAELADLPDYSTLKTIVRGWVHDIVKAGSVPILATLPHARRPSSDDDHKNRKPETKIGKLNVGMERFNKAARKIASEENVPLLDAWAILNAAQPQRSVGLTRQGHPTRAGYVMMARRFMELHQAVFQHVFRLPADAASDAD